MALILVIDDDDSVQTLFSQFLTNAGYSVAVASSGRDGLDQAREKKPDLIITDIMMPEMDGLEIIRAIRADSPDLPVIAISGGMRNLPFNFLPHAKKFGACRVFEKPVALAELKAAIHQLLGNNPEAA
jgi:CheY-like chemotaxis protein